MSENSTENPPIPSKIALLPDRGVVSVTGDDAAKLLGGVLTNDIERLESEPAIFAGLLSPQGKLLFEFLVVRAEEGGGFHLDVARDRASDLAKRLTMYRLRAKADIRDVSDDHRVFALWEGHPHSFARPAYRDPRAPGLGIRFISQALWAVDDASATNGLYATPQDYHAHRIGLGVPEGGRDYDFGDVFPHEANFDLLDGVVFDKGCYVGQEIVARMQHRGTVRKRVVRVTAAAPLPATRPDVMFGDVVIGRLGSVTERPGTGSQGLALLRLDRAIEAIDSGKPIMADGIVLEIDAGMIARQRQLMTAKTGHI
jgi:tRNA-modifying protein YgfZ